MQHDDSADLYVPQNYPWQVAEGSPADEWSRTEGYDDQWALIAEHVVAGGSVETAPHPPLRKYYDKFLRPTVEGIQRARMDAVDLVRASLYDADSVIADVAAARAEEDARDAEVDPGYFTPPENMETARVHTTITSVFTDRFVYDIVGEEFTPTIVSSKTLTLRGRLHLCGHQDIDTGIDLDGTYQVDLVEAGSGLPGSGDPVLRLLWGPEDSIVGAVECGWLTAWAKAGGFGPAGSSKQARQAFGEFPLPGELAAIETESGVSMWCFVGGYGGPFRVFLAVDRHRSPVGVLLDNTNLSSFYWFEEEDGEPESKSSEWPPDAREFDILSDERGFNPNIKQQCKSPSFFPWQD